jgi:hypothetical protein
MLAFMCIISILQLGKQQLISYTVQGHGSHRITMAYVHSVHGDEETACRTK